MESAPGADEGEGVRGKAAGVIEAVEKRSLKGLETGGSGGSLKLLLAAPTKGIWFVHRF